MNIEIYGRHALLFDDDAAAAFVNSDDALVEWNSLLIDRYDVRHLLSAPPPSRRRRNPQTSHSSSADADLDHERYLDLPSPSDEEEEDTKPEPTGGFKAVPFSYGNDEDSDNQKTAETEPEAPKFHPPFSVPDSLVQNLPPTEKVHQIIARTALFVSKNGGQSEIILRVKQGDNPTFGFLMPDHHLHPYFRFLVDHQDLLHSKDNAHPENDEKISNTGALSLLGSVYGTGEDDDGVTEQSLSKEHVSGNNVNVDSSVSLAAVKTVLPSGKDEHVLKRNCLSNALKVGRTSSVKKDELLGSLSSVPDKSRASSLPPIPKTELMLVDPPTEMKRLVEKIVEFIIKNGRQFEAVLMEQDRGHGRFPFLIPSNIFHPYYLKVLQKAQESKLTVKSFYNEKEDFRGRVSNKKKSSSRENGNDTMEPDDIPLDSERKEKFKMVINKSKKDGSDLPDKSTQSPPRVQVDADQAAAILQAATRGIKPSSLGILYGQPSNEDSSQLTHEQKLKAERLKRAKMFVAQLKSGGAPLKAEPSRSVSAEPPVKETEKSTLPSDKFKLEKEDLNEEKRATRKYRARSIRDNQGDGDDYDDDDDDERERKSSHRHHRKKHRSHSHSVEDEREENYVDERDYKHDKRRHRSHRSSHKHDDMDKITEEKDRKDLKKKHQSSSSYEDDEQKSEHEYSRKKHRTHHSSHDEVDSDDKHSRKKHRSHHSSHDEVDSDDKHSRRKRKHRSHKSSHRHKHRKSHSSRHKEKLDVSSEEESRDQNKTDKNVKGPNSEREELEEGEITGPSKGARSVDGASREPSVDVSSSQPSGATEVPDDLRAKIRAMLMSTM
ncbi:putative suppressor of white apricot domain, SWAP/Surp superfamily [Helianthus annuus]|nr:putative suppressor of white apricot domain, SWAP/Surp superfamily [Helianthus annuus]KAJ0630488.1 putative suppressor of white apricot domain, SWAP/Surp superfamily [Helianthus annuus]KAJ0684979.1 putative suppressor of white apricot domain, SWAP/Surp superfamily [Helianthus annuus]KAJ0688907.1 putative suppressor of white apricot domain, SWAP/Surp superfamily [Helianthus annuus]KAJ0870136.1 putative suppressor of white apricot domain, SWAP/Surp superfamily [Helianthus annuus]